jgi:hypothetical protein
MIQPYFQITAHVARDGMHKDAPKGTTVHIKAFRAYPWRWGLDGCIACRVTDPKCVRGWWSSIWFDLYKGVSKEEKE